MTVVGLPGSLLWNCYCHSTVIIQYLRFSVWAEVVMTLKQTLTVFIQLCIKCYVSAYLIV